MRFATNLKDLKKREKVALKEVLESPDDKVGIGRLRMRELRLVTQVPELAVRRAATDKPINDGPNDANTLLATTHAADSAAVAALVLLPAHHAAQALEAANVADRVGLDEKDEGRQLVRVRSAPQDLAQERFIGCR